MCDRSVLGQCVCGGTVDEPNLDDCERCRMVYTLRKVRQMRDAQKDYFRDRASATLVRSKKLEAFVDGCLDKLLSDPDIPF